MSKTKNPFAGPPLDDEFDAPETDTDIETSSLEVDEDVDLDDVQEDDAQPVIPQPKGITGVANPQGLHRPTGPSEEQLRAQATAQQAQASQKQAALDAAAAEQLQAQAPVVARFRGYHPQTGQALFAWKGQTLMARELPPGVKAEALPQPAQQPVV